MKKIISIIIILVVVWLGFIWYANSTTEEKLHTYTDKINKMYQEMDLGIELKLVEYESHFFTAHSKYALTINPEKLLTEVNPYFMLLSSFGGSNTKNEIYEIFEKPFTINQKIEYGPVFFSDGLEFGRAKTSFKASLSETLAKIANKINKNIDDSNSLKMSEENIKAINTELSKVLKQPVQLEYSSILALFSSDNTIRASISRIEAEKKSKYSKRVEKFIVDPIVMNSTFNLNDFTGDFDFNIPLISFTKNDEEKFRIKNLNISSDIHEYINAWTYFGNVDISVDEVKIFTYDGDTIFKAGIFTDIIRNADQNLSDSKIKASVEILKYPEGNRPAFDLPKTIDVTIDMLGINSREFYQAYYKINDYIYVEMFSDNPRDPDTFYQEDIKPHLGKVFSKDKTKFGLGFEISTEKLPNVKNYAKLDMTYKLTNDELFNIIDLVKNQEIGIDLITLAKKSFDINLDIAAHKDIIKPVEMFLMQAQQMGIIIEDADMIKSNIKYSNGKVLINDEENEMITQQLQMLEQIYLPQ